MSNHPRCYCEKLNYPGGVNSTACPIHANGGVGLLVEDHQPTDLTFKFFSAVSMERHLNWPRNNGDKPPQHEWDLSAWGCAIAEEAGEVCGAIKRVNRIAAGHIMKKPGEPKTKEEAILRLKKEIGDAVTYLDLCAQELGSDLEECTRLAFNGVSERENLPYNI